MLARDLVPPIGEVKGGFEDSQHTVSGRAPLSYCSGLLGSKGRPVSFLALAFFLALGFFALLSAIFFLAYADEGRAVAMLCCHSSMRSVVNRDN